VHHGSLLVLLHESIGGCSKIYSDCRFLAISLIICDIENGIVSHKAFFEALPILQTVSMPLNKRTSNCFMIVATSTWRSLERAGLLRVLAPRQHCKMKEEQQEETKRLVDIVTKILSHILVPCWAPMYSCSRGMRRQPSLLCNFSQNIWRKPVGGKSSCWSCNDLHNQL
jgi:hypothetical protein